MSIQLGTTVRNARLDQIETTIGTSPILKLRTGSAPANAGTADSGTVLCSITLPSDWLAAASSGAKSKSGTWSSTGIGGGGTVAHFRIYDSGGSTCHIQGTVTISGGGGDMTLDNNVVADGQTITVVTFALTDGNA